MVRRLIALLLVTAAPLARGDDTSPLGPEPEVKPYTEGWHGGSPPGEHVIIRANLWILDSQRTELEVGHEQRTLLVTSHDLGEQGHGVAGGLGIEGYGGKLGWLSLDWWTVQSRAETQLRRTITLDETIFAQGAVVDSEVTQHVVKIRDGLDIRYRIPIGDETWLDFNFGPVMSLMFRYEAFTVSEQGSGLAVKDSLLAVSIVPGWRAGIDFHALDGFIVRVGSDVDLLPHLDHNPLSFTREPSLDAWADARAFLAVRFEIVEASVGWRYFRSLASGGHFRQAETDMKGGFLELAARF
ncbi:MAG TPA: hypothetical protein VFF73_25405 [Planctomycetota bacterium]|nr:hypothetical protein [Planctomycetota bacterium]